MRNYQIPAVVTVENIDIPALTQSGSELTGLTGCGITSDCQTQQGTDTFHLNMCAVGITDPSDLNGSSHVINYSGGQGCDDLVLPLSNCTTTQIIGCDPGSLAVSCEYTDSCAIIVVDCSFESEGVSTDGNFIACPPEA